jgi:hypothetical protein
MPSGSEPAGVVVLAFAFLVVIPKGSAVVFIFFCVFSPKIACQAPE